MPGGMNGRELARTVAETHPGLKVQLVTGFSKGLGGKATSGDERYPVLRKPYSRAQLAGCVRKVLDAANGHRPQARRKRVECDQEALK
jgi:DNA-binding NtrC family response regulator